VGKRLGRDPASLTLIGIYELFGVQVPSGKAQRRPGGSYLGITFVTPKTEEEPEPPQHTFPAPGDAGGEARLPTGDPGLPNSRAPSGPKAGIDPKDILPDTQSEEIEILSKALLKSHPAGLIEIDPASVVAPGEVPAYDVLPVQAGFIQLIRSGAVRRTSEKTYVVLREIPSLPAEWTIHSQPYRRILFGKNVPQPGGAAEKRN
jgi:hypothetical protein